MREEIDYIEALQRFKNNPHITIMPWGRNVNHLRVTITGQAGTPYDGTQFLFEIKIPPNYPQQPPFVFCHTLIWHPNILQGVAPVREGATNVCLDLLAPDRFRGPDKPLQNEAWTPSNTLADVIEALDAMIQLKSPPNPSMELRDEARKLWFE